MNMLGKTPIYLTWQVMVSFFFLSLSFFQFKSMHLSDQFFYEVELSFPNLQDFQNRLIGQILSRNFFFFRYIQNAPKTQQVLRKIRKRGSHFWTLILNIWLLPRIRSMEMIFGIMKDKYVSFLGLSRLGRFGRNFTDFDP